MFWEVWVQRHDEYSLIRKRKGVLKTKQNIIARDSQGNEYSTMEEIFGFRMPDFTLSISQFMEDQISIEVKVRDDE